jgi:hypothetical protein
MWLAFQLQIERSWVKLSARRPVISIEISWLSSLPAGKQQDNISN